MKKYLAVPAALLRRASLLATLLAIVAGLLGMHVLAGSHGVHDMAGAAASADGSVADQRTTATAGHASDAGHGGHGSHQAAAMVGPAKAVPAPAAENTAGRPPSCSCQGNCSEVAAAHGSCVPAPGGASLAAPQPGTVAFAVPDLSAARLQAVAAYAYVPGSPSPGDLSISRT
ncbi:hypothetical protein [Arthrobacter humicola]